ncbi:MAG: hypothetical protein KAH32_01760 [Chlamydiia bacterium]|nr:hypothetical protein [Chlamydiia bacterium]
MEELNNNEEYLMNSDFDSTDSINEQPVMIDDAFSATIDDEEVIDDEVADDEAPVVDEFSSIEDEEDDDEDDDFDDDLFAEFSSDIDEDDIVDTSGFAVRESRTAEVGAGLKTRARITKVDISKRKTGEGKTVKLQTFVTFTVYTDSDVVVGEKEISFFLLTPSKKNVITSLVSYLQKLKSILSVYVTSEELDTFDPIRETMKIEGDDIKKSDYTEKNIRKKVLTTVAIFNTLQDAINKQFSDLLTPYIGNESKIVRLLLEESEDKEHIQIPFYNDFIEDAEVPMSESKLV